MSSTSAPICWDSCRADKRDQELPPALRPVKEKPQAKDAAAGNANIDLRRLREAQGRGNHWLRAHYDLHPKDWTYYYLYALERYYSFRELAEAKSEKEPQWYTDGARYLIRTQDADGSWIASKSAGGATADTAFATLFLLRSAKKSIEKAYGYGDSTLVAGRGLPKDTSRVFVSRGEVLAVPSWDSAEKLLPLLQQREEATFERALDALAQLPSKEAGILAARYADGLRGLLADRSLRARLAAVRVLGNSGDIDQMPLLVYAMGDPEVTVAHAAADALRRSTRSPGTGPLPQQLTEPERRAEIQHWKDWYRAVRPDAEFED